MNRPIGILFVCYLLFVPGVPGHSEEGKHLVLGVKLGMSSPPGAERKGLPIEAVEPDGPAQRAGLKVGDLVLSINDLPITSLDEFRKVMQTFKVHDEVSVKVWRDAQVVACPVKLEEGLIYPPMLVLDAGGHTAVVRKVLFTPDGRTLITVSEDKTIRLWDVTTGEPLRVLRPPALPGPVGLLLAAALSPDGHTLAAAGFTLGVQGPADPGPVVVVYLIDLASGKMVKLLAGHSNVILSLDFSPDRRRLASGSADGTVRIWELATGRSEHELRGHAGAVTSVAFSPDGKRLASAAQDSTGRIWSVADGRELAVLRGQPGCHCVAWRPDGQVVATGGDQSTINLWGPDGKSYQGFNYTIGTVSSLAFTRDSQKLLFTRGPMLTGCAILDLGTREQSAKFDRHTQGVTASALSPDGTLAATVGMADEVYLWRTTDGSVAHRLAPKGRAPVAAVWGADGQTIQWDEPEPTVAGKPADPPLLDRSFRLSDLELAELDAANRPYVPERYVMNYSGFAPGASQPPNRIDKEPGALAFDLQPKEAAVLKQGNVAVVSLKKNDLSAGINGFGLLPGNRLFIGDAEGLKLFDSRSGARLKSIMLGTSVFRHTVSPDGRLVLTLSGDSVLRVWDFARPAPLVLSLFVAGDEWVAWTQEGYYAASPGGERLMGWHLNIRPDLMANFHPAEQFRKSLYRPDVVKLLLKASSLEQALELAAGEGPRPTKTVTAPVQISAVLPPEVEIAAPRSGSRLSAPQVAVQAIARGRGDQPVTVLRLLVDGRPFGGRSGAKVVNPPRTGEVKESWEIELEPGTHQIAVQAESAVSQGKSDAIEVSIESSKEDRSELPGLYVLAIGVSAYPGDLRLNYAAKDAEVITQTLREKSAPLFRTVEVKLLTDAEATRTEVLRGLTWMKQQMTQRDVGIVFYSGHGQRDAEGSLYLLPVDVDVDDLLATGVADTQLKAALAAMPGRILTLLDACHAGAVGGDRRKGVGGLTDNLIRDLVTDDYGVIVMASSMGREFSLENNAKRQGSFTVALTEGLEGKADINNDGVVYLNELDAYITDRVKELTKGQQHPVTAKPTSIRSFPLAKP